MMKLKHQSETSSFMSQGNKTLGLPVMIFFDLNVWLRDFLCIEIITIDKLLILFESAQNTFGHLVWHSFPATDVKYQWFYEYPTQSVGHKHLAINHCIIKICCKWQQVWNIGV